MFDILKLVFLSGKHMYDNPRWFKWTLVGYIAQFKAYDCEFGVV